MDRSKLVCSHDDLAKLKDFVNKTDVIESCSQERMNTKWTFYKSTNLTVFAALLNDVPLGTEHSIWSDIERVKNVYPRNVYQIRETLFDKLNSFGIKYTSEQKLFKNLAIFDFESICVQAETIRDTNTTIWIGNMSRYLYPFLQTLWKNQFSSANLILITS